MSLLDRLSLEHPVVQAGMGGGLADGMLAGTVAAAGGLGTVGILAPEALRRELERAREFAGGGSIAANLLVPFARRAHAEACRRVGVQAVVLHAGFNRQLVEELRSGGAIVLQTVGTPSDAKHALSDGADGLVVQGIEAGGHLVGVERALDAVAHVKEVSGGALLLVAGGIADSEDARRALGAGADAVVAGTRFLLTHECPAHPLYKQAVLNADRTVQTQLFGLGWPMRHRVVPNAATERWCGRDGRVSAPLRALHALSAPMGRLPLSLTAGSIRAQRPSLPVFGPAAPLQGMPDRLIDAAALYAGETALRIDSLVPAADATRLLAGALPAQAS